MIANETILRASRFLAVSCAVVFSLSLFAAYLISSGVYLCTYMRLRVLMLHGMANKMCA